MLSSADDIFNKIETWSAAGDEDAVANLVNTLHTDSEVEARTKAAEVLGKLKMTSAVDGLAKGIQDKKGAVRVKSVEALGRIGGEAALQHLLAILNDRDEAARMMAAESVLPGGIQKKSGRPEMVLRNEAFDIQWAAVEGVGRIGNPSGFDAAYSWAERMFLSDARPLSLDEKLELTRQVFEPLLRGMDSSQTYTLSSNLPSDIHAISWESTPGTGDYVWNLVNTDNPLQAMLRDEMSRRRDQYMKSLNNRDTLFSESSGEGTANKADTLFNPMDAPSQSAAPEPATQNPKDTLFEVGTGAPTTPENVQDTLFISNAGGGRASGGHRSVIKDSSDETVLDLKRACLEKFDAGVSLFDVNKGAPVEEQPEPEPFDPEEIERKREAYQETLGPRDTLFQPSVPVDAPEAAPPQPALTPGSVPQDLASSFIDKIDEGLDDDLFGDFGEPAAQQPPAPSAPATGAQKAPEPVNQRPAAGSTPSAAPPSDWAPKPITPTPAAPPPPPAQTPKPAPTPHLATPSTPTSPPTPAPPAPDPVEQAASATPPDSPEPIDTTPPGGTSLRAELQRKRQEAEARAEAEHEDFPLAQAPAEQAIDEPEPVQLPSEPAAQAPPEPAPATPQPAPTQPAGLKLAARKVESPTEEPAPAAPEPQKQGFFKKLISKLIGRGKDS